MTHNTGKLSFRTELLPEIVPDIPTQRMQAVKMPVPESYHLSQGEIDCSAINDLLRKTKLMLYIFDETDHKFLRVWHLHKNSTSEFIVVGYGSEADKNANQLRYKAFPWQHKFEMYFSLP